MKKYFLLSFCIHLAVIVPYFYIKEPEQVTDTSSLETVNFDLGLLAAPIESIEVKKAASKAQQQQTAGAKPRVQTQSDQMAPPDRSLEKSVEKAERNTETVNTDNSKPLVPKAKNASKQESMPATNELKPALKKERKKDQKKELKKELTDGKSNEKTNTTKPLKQQSSNTASNALGMEENREASIESLSTDDIQQATGGKASESKKQNVNSASYTADLQRRISQQAARTYSRKAKRKRQQGVVKVAFVIAANGKINDIKVVTSSGHLLLDKSAIKAVQRVGKYRPLPEGVNPNFEIPIRFSLL